MEQIHYWAGGYGNKELTRKDQIARLQKFIENEYWQADYKNDDTARTNKQKALFSNVNIGDKFLIKGFGGKYKVIVYFVGEVIRKNDESYRLDLKKEDFIPYNDRAPEGKGAGNWFNTLLEVKRQNDIDTFFRTRC